MVYIASLNDQVVPVYSGSFASASHPLILRALYIDGDAYQYVLNFGSKCLVLNFVRDICSSSDFLSNLLVLLLRIRNANLPDGGLLAHLSEATAGSLNGVGHSTAYEELATFSYVHRQLYVAVLLMYSLWFPDLQLNISSWLMRAVAIFTMRTSSPSMQGQP